MAGFLATALLLAANLATVHGNYCTFYSDDKCTSQVGSVNYEAGNENCLFNSGHFIDCDIKGINYGIEQYPRHQCGGNPKGYFGFDGTCTDIAAIASREYQYKLYISGITTRATSGGVNKTEGTLPFPVDEPPEPQAQSSLNYVEGLTAKDKAALEKRADTCEARIEFYYGNECKGPAAVFDEQVPVLGPKDSNYMSPCHNDGLYGRYVTKRSTCDVVLWDGDNCTGKPQDLFTEPLGCRVVHGEDYTVRSWQWRCDVDACNDQFGT
ncbi:Ecp29 [Fulvia fulva]|uniref:Ecp29 n=1 Tax=Passalora fulva TaxID=5499 RepID=A0A1P8YXN5_PASFU|nr:Ecp29 [Fulvia fulva]AQA29274.1 extracellular protein 29 [Fulvia fulva]KAK4619764.1 Ecp29 [Fulvia fulva]KAK4620393.1 Ecp29 [Fulvia fulva]UJO19794.1 Ecp29 [Fulvia fulva]WPV17135.1 Ecp29 [Fulvia fulva]